MKTNWRTHWAAIAGVVLGAIGLSGCDDAKAAGMLTVQGSYAAVNTNLCSYTADSLGNTTGDHTITQTQQQGVSSTTTYDTAGKLSIKFVTENFIVRSKLKNTDNSVVDFVPMARATAKGTCDGTYMLANNILSSDYHCSSATVEGANAGTSNYTKHITGRSVVTDVGIIRQVDYSADVPAPSEEAVFTWPTTTQVDTKMLDAADDLQPLPQALKDMGVTRVFRMCSRLGTQMKMP
jgi:hypothetical protein